MRVVFIQYGPDISCAQMMVESCKRFGYEVWQLSDDIAPRIPGVDVLERKPKDCGRMMYRARRLAELDGEYVLMDTDMIVAQDISDGMNGDHDVALSWRAKNNVVTKRGPVHMPYNGGLIFVRNNGFMRDCLAEMETMDDYFQDWYGDQVALRDVASDGKYKIRELKDGKWNYVPETPGDFDRNVKVFHFKGLRKSMMADYYARLTHDH